MIEHTPIEDSGSLSGKFDAKGNPRTLRSMGDGTYANLSDSEYAEEKDSRRDDRQDTVSN